MPKNPAYQAYVDSIVSFAKDQAKKILLREVGKRLPFLFVTGLNPITTLVLSKLVDILFRETEFLIFYAYVDVRTSAQGRAFSEAAINYNRALKDGTLSEEDKKKYEETLITKFRNFVVIGNV